VRFKEKPGQMFGGKGVAVFSPFPKQQSRSETGGLTPEDQLASEAESAVMRLISANQQPNTAPQSKGR
jgi:hypothetical protein